LSEPYGILLLKIVIREAHIDTNATERHLREKISSLDVFIASISHYVEKFNAHVINFVNGLRARGHTSQDVLANLFKAYKTVPDQEFVRYIKEKEDDYDDGTDTTPEALMLRAVDKYKRMVEAKEWKAPSPEHKKIIALEAAMKKLSPKQSKTNASPKSKTVKRKKSYSTKGKTSGNKSKPEWMTKAPPTRNPQIKTLDGKEYHWCSKHKAWGRHQPQECKGVGVDMSKTSNKKEISDNSCHGDHRSGTRMRKRPRKMRLSWAVMVNPLQINYHLVDCRVHHRGPHDPSYGLRPSSTIHPKEPTQSHERIAGTMDTGNEIMDQTDPGPLLCTIQTMETQMEICRTKDKSRSTFH
jgi:hypothetical protein